MERGNVRVRVRITETKDEVRASAVDLEACGVGGTRAAAIEQVREAVRDRMKPEGVALPSRSREATIDVAVVEDEEGEERARDPDGPGSPSPAEATERRA